jgi:hypothetical protein
MPPTLPACAKIVEGVHFVPVVAPVARGKRALRYQCLHPLCTTPLHARHFARHVRGKHVQCYNNFRDNGDVIPVPDDREDRLLGPIWGSAACSTEQHHPNVTEGDAAATQNEAVPPPQLPDEAQETSMAPEEQVNHTLTAPLGGTPVKHKLLKEPLAPSRVSSTPEVNPEHGNVSHSQPAELADIVYNINEAVEKYTEELHNSSCMDLPPELSLFTQVCPQPLPIIHVPQQY